MRRMLLAVLAGAALMSSGCGDSHDKVTADMLDALRDMNGVLENVKDPASAEAAVDELAAIRDRMQTLKKRADAMEDPGAEQQTALKEKYEEPMKKEVMTLMGHMMRINQNPELREKLGDAMGGPSGSPIPMFQ